MPCESWAGLWGCGGSSRESHAPVAGVRGNQTWATCLAPAAVLGGARLLCRGPGFTLWSRCVNPHQLVLHLGQVQVFLQGKVEFSACYCLADPYAGLTMEE